MQIFFTEQVEAHAVCMIQLEKDEQYNNQNMIQACLEHCGGEYAGSSIIESFGNGLHKVSVKIDYHPHDDIFAEMVREYGKA